MTEEMLELIRECTRLRSALTARDEAIQVAENALRVGRDYWRMTDHDIDCAYYESGPCDCPLLPNGEKIGAALSALAAAKVQG